MHYEQAINTSSSQGQNSFDRLDFNNKISPHENMCMYACMCVEYKNKYSLLTKCLYACGASRWCPDTDQCYTL